MKRDLLILFVAFLSIAMFVITFTAAGVLSMWASGEVITLDATKWSCAAIDPITGQCAAYFLNPDSVFQGVASEN